MKIPRRSGGGRSILSKLSEFPENMASSDAHMAHMSRPIRAFRVFRVFRTSFVKRISTRLGIGNWYSECGPHNEKKKELMDEESHCRAEQKTVVN
jgi:hypothetical protein